MRQAMTDIIGNAGLCRRLCDDIVSGTSSHAYILAGAHGSGRHTIALRYAAALACENKHQETSPLPCLHCPSCKKILEGKSPDVIVIEKMGQSVKIEQIRALKNDVFVVPNDLENKIYIIEDADTMTEPAQNAFLLTLEEPPPFVRFFLLCSKPEKLLETIRSRAPILRTEILPRALVSEYLTSQNDAARALANANDKEFEEILTIASGSIGRGLELCDDTERAPLIKQRRMASDFIDMALRKQYASLVEQILQFPKKQDEVMPILWNMQSALRDLIALKKTSNAPLVFYTDRESTMELAFTCSTALLLSLYQKLSICVDNISRNANIRLTLTALLSEI